MDECYVVLCANDKTNDQRSFVAFSRSDAQFIKASFLHSVEYTPDWSVIIIRSVEE